MPTQKIPGVPEKRPPEARAAFSSATAGIVRCIQRLEEQKANIVDMGGKLKPGGRILTASGVTDGPLPKPRKLLEGTWWSPPITTTVRSRSLENAATGCMLTCRLATRRIQTHAGVVHAQALSRCAWKLAALQLQRNVRCRDPF
jgi:hypothetical protein